MLDYFMAGLILRIIMLILQTLLWLVIFSFPLGNGRNLFNLLNPILMNSVPAKILLKAVETEFHTEKPLEQQDSTIVLVKPKPHKAQTHKAQKVEAAHHKKTPHPKDTSDTPY